MFRTTAWSSEKRAVALAFIVTCEMQKLHASKTIVLRSTRLLWRTRLSDLFVARQGCGRAWRFATIQTGPRVQSKRRHCIARVVSLMDIRHVQLANLSRQNGFQGTFKVPHKPIMLRWCPVCDFAHTCGHGSIFSCHTHFVYHLVDGRLPSFIVWLERDTFTTTSAFAQRPR